MVTDTSIEEWKALYKAAAEFREIEPWKWVKETDIFGVQNPLTGEIGYCCIMGELGEMFAIAIYRGTEGLNGFQKILNDQIESESDDMLNIQNCLMTSFENKNTLEKEDKALIKKLGIQAKGKRAWPMFRRYDPGFFPWFIEKDDIRYLTVALQQAGDVCLRLKEIQNLLVPPEKDLYMVRSYDKDTNRWNDVWIKPDPEKQIIFQAPLIDEIHIQRIKKIAKPSSAAWETDFFYSPTPIKSENRPYFPYAIMIADSESGFIHEMYLSEKSKYPSEFTSRFLACVEKTASLPNKILVRKDEVLTLLKPITSKLGIEISKVSKLTAIDAARRSMENHFLRHKDSTPLQKGYCGDDIMDELLEKSGAEISIFGLYGLFYGCLAAPNPVIPSTFMPVIFGKDGPQFKTEKDAEKTIVNMMELWNLIAGWNPETNDFLIPVFSYSETVEGILYRISDAIDLIDFFLEGLEYGGITPEDVPDELDKDIKVLLNITSLLYQYLEIIEKAQQLNHQEIRDNMKAIDNAEIIIDGSITNIFACLKGIRLDTEVNLPSNFGLNERRYKVTNQKTGRNDPCPCGSGKKYKKCCGLLH